MTKAKPETPRNRVDREIIKHLRAENDVYKSREWRESKLEKENAELKEELASHNENNEFQWSWVQGKLGEMEDRVNRASDHVASMNSSIFREREALAQSVPAQLQNTIAERDLEVEFLKTKLADTERKLRAARRRNVSAAAKRKTKK